MTKQFRNPGIRYDTTKQNFVLWFCFHAENYLWNIVKVLYHWWCKMQNDLTKTWNQAITKPCSLIMKTQGNSVCDLSFLHFLIFPGGSCPSWDCGSSLHLPQLKPIKRWKSIVISCLAGWIFCWQKEQTLVKLSFFPGEVDFIIYFVTSYKVKEHQIYEHIILPFIYLISS